MPKCFAVLAGVVLGLLVQIIPSYAELYLFIDGILGESKGPNRQGWSDIKSVSWGVGESPPGSAMKVQFRRLELTKPHDSIAPALALLASTGKPVRELRVEAARMNGGVEVVTTRVRLTGVRVSNIATAGLEQVSTNLITDSVAFSFDTITWTYFKFDETGRTAGTFSTCFDVRTNIPC